MNDFLVIFLNKPFMYEILTKGIPRYNLILIRLLNVLRFIKLSFMTISMYNSSTRYSSTIKTRIPFPGRNKTEAMGSQKRNCYLPDQELGIRNQI